MSYDLAAPLRAAILANATIVALIATWNGEPAVFTRRPVPDDAPYPLILIGPDISVGDQDFLTSRLPKPRRDIAVYGLKGAPGADDYRKVEEIGYLLRTQFHRQRQAITVPGFHVLDIRASGPREAPTDSVNEIGRIVPLQIRLQDLSTS